MHAHSSSQTLSLRSITPNHSANDIEFTTFPFYLASLQMSTRVACHTLSDRVRPSALAQARARGTLQRAANFLIASQMENGGRQGWVLTIVGNL